MKPISNYFAPVLCLAILAFCDYAFIVFNSKQPDPVLITCQQVIVLRAVWSQLVAMWKNPGFIPLEYAYEKQKFSETVRALLTMNRESNKVVIVSQSSDSFLPSTATILHRYLQQEVFIHAETESVQDEESYSPSQDEWSQRASSIQTIQQKESLLRKDAGSLRSIESKRSLWSHKDHRNNNANHQVALVKVTVADEMEFTQEANQQQQSKKVTHSQKTAAIQLKNLKMSLSSQRSSIELLWSFKNSINNPTSRYSVQSGDDFELEYSVKLTQDETNYIQH